MESVKEAPSVNLDCGGCEKNPDRIRRKSDRKMRGDNKTETETQTCRDRGGCEIPDSKTSFEITDIMRKEGYLSTTSSSCASEPIHRKSKKGKDRRSKRHQADKFESNDSSPGSIRSSAQSPLAETRITKCEDQAGEEKSKENEPGTGLISPVRENLMEENKRLKEVLSRERRHHTKEKNRIKQVLFAIDKALAGLPNRLGKIRLQNQKNLMNMNDGSSELHDRGDYDLTGDRIVDSSQGIRLEKAASLPFSEDMNTDISNNPNTMLVNKMKSLNNLIEEIKTGHSAPIEVVLDNELCAISMLKDEIKNTKKQIEQKSKTDSESVIAVNWQSPSRDATNAGEWSMSRTIDSDDIEKLEKYIQLQKEAISVLSLEVQKTKQLVYKEIKEKEQIESEKKALLTEITELKAPRKSREEAQRLKGRPCENCFKARPFRMIQELKTELEEKDKIIANIKSKMTRMEAATANKGILLENEKKKVEELEAKVKMVTSENKSFSMQINSLQYLNKEMKDQMEILKKQTEVLIKQNSELSAPSSYDLKPHFNELAEMLKNEDSRVRSVQEEAHMKMTHMENQYMDEINLIRTTFEKSEKMNFEYMRTLKALLLAVHNHQLERNCVLKKKHSYNRVREILGITELELEKLFGENTKETSEKELAELYDQCYSFVADDEDCEFSLKLSTWLFDVIKEKMTEQNSSEKEEYP